MRVRSILGAADRASNGGHFALNIVLIGYRACGKSTVGALVARQLGCDLIDVDREIERRAGMTITQAYQSLGDAKYRDLESQVVADVCSDDDRRRIVVIAMGAGSIMRTENQAHAMRNGLVVYLKLSAEQLWQRMQRDPNSAATRPNLAGGGLDEVVQVLALREPAYERCAALHLDASLPPEVLADQILSRLSNGERP